MTENHEFCTCFRQYPLNELQSVSTQSVYFSVPDRPNNVVDHSFVYSVQKGLKTFTLVVEAGTDVGERT